MSAEALLKEVEERLQKELAELEADYAKKMEEARKNSEIEINKVMVEAEGRAKELAEKEKTKITGSARLQAKRIVAGATQTYIERGLKRMTEALKKFSGSKEYTELLSKMLKYAQKRLGDDVRVRCRPQDRQAFLKLGAEVEEAKLESVGGAVFVSADGRLELNLTFEELIRLRAEELRAAILGLGAGQG